MDEQQDLATEEDRRGSGAELGQTGNEGGSGAEPAESAVRAALAAQETRVAGLEAQLVRAVDLTASALRAANGDLPPAVFESRDLDVLSAAVASARAVADYVMANAAKPAAAGLPAGGVTRVAQQAPAGAKGIGRIQWALRHPGAGSTE